jgi:predicted DNA-binding transcriptional regulator
VIGEDTLLEAELKGKTLMVYMYLLKSDDTGVGVREVQRALNFSSPSVASYHLNKLNDLGLVENRYGDYFLVKEVKIGVLKQFVSFGGIMLPRYLFYAVLLTSMLITYLFQFPFFLTAQNISSIIIGLVPTLILWYETIKIWRERPQ